MQSAYKKMCFFCVQGVCEGTLHCCGVQILSDTQSQSCSLISAHLLLTPPGSQLCCVLISSTVSVLSVCPWMDPARLLRIFLEILNATEFILCCGDRNTHFSASVFMSASHAVCKIRHLGLVRLFTRVNIA